MMKHESGDGRRRTCTRVWSRATAVAGVSLAVALMLSLASGAGAADLAQPTADPQMNQEGQVTVAVTWIGTTEEPAFMVVLDTHAGDLDAYDVSQLAVLRTDQGSELSATSWDAPLGGHHREGTLRFPATPPDVQTIELVIRDIAGVPERTFVWTW